MTRTVRVLPHPKDRRRVAHAHVHAHAKGKHRAVPSYPAATTSTSTIDDEHEEPGDAPTFLDICWPTVFGVALAIIAEHLRAKVIRDFGDAGDRLVFPFVQIVSRPELGLGDLGASLSKLMLYLQFPLTGLYASWNLSRHHKLSTTLIQIGFTYGVIAFVLWLLTTPGSSHGM
jgi:hypothetical protein